MIIKSPPPSPTHPPTHSVFWQKTNRVEWSWSAGDLRNLFKPNVVINYFKQLLALIKIWWKSQTNKWYILIMTILNSVKNDKDIYYLYTWKGLFITAFLIASGTLVSVSSSYIHIQLLRQTGIKRWSICFSKKMALISRKNGQWWKIFDAWLMRDDFCWDLRGFLFCQSWSC